MGEWGGEGVSYKLDFRTARDTILCLPFFVGFRAKGRDKRKMSCESFAKLGFARRMRKFCEFTDK